MQKFQEPPDPYFDNHKIGIEDHFKQDPTIERYAKRCFEIFEASEAGKDLKQLVIERYLMHAMFSPMAPHSDAQALYFEGFKEAFRSMFHLAKQYQQLINKQGVNIGT